MAKHRRNNQSFSRMNKSNNRSSSKKYEQFSDYIEFGAPQEKPIELTEEEIRLRDTPLFELYPDATLINNWDELVNCGIESDTHYLRFDEEDKIGGRVCNGWIKSKEDDDSWGTYLSTHTFYGANVKTYRESTHQLQKCGFNVIIKNWDGETI